jgi:uncharacterized protein
MGVFSAQTLALIEEQMKFYFATTADVFAGTSVGALIAAGLACGCSGRQIADAFGNSGTAIFGGEAFLWPKIISDFASNASAIKKARYDPEPLEKVILGLIGERRMGDLSKVLMVPALDLTGGTYRIFTGGPNGRDPTLLIKDVILASAAAPVYFPARTINCELFADGGLIANAPDSIVVTEAITRYAMPREKIRLLSIGTTRYPAALASKGADAAWGLYEWMKGLKLLKLSMAAQVDLSRDLARKLLADKAMLVLDPILSLDQSDVIGLDRADAAAANTLTALAARQAAALDDEASRFIALWKGSS